MTLLMLMIFSFSGSYAQKEKFQSIFIYNFTKYIKWPENYNPESFVITVLGNSPILSSLKQMAAQKAQTNGKNIEVRKANNLSEIGNSHVLFVSENQLSQLDKIQSNTSGKPVLIITEKPGMGTQGATINFVEKDSKIKFELNQASAESKGLKVSSSLTSLAILI
jgi:hypothetical protein